SAVCEVEVDPRDRPRRGCPVHIDRRLRPGGEPDADPWAEPWRYRARDRPGAMGGMYLRPAVRPARKCRCCLDLERRLSFLRARSRDHSRKITIPSMEIRQPTTTPSLDAIKFQITQNVVQNMVKWIDTNLTSCPEFAEFQRKRLEYTIFGAPDEGL